MITRDNLEYILRDIDKDTLTKVMNGNKDFVKVESHVFNIGGYTTIEECDYSEELEKEIQENGNLFCEKEGLLQLFDEVGIKYEEI